MKIRPLHDRVIVWPGAVTELTANGHDVLWVGDWPADPGDGTRASS
jgi:hypothetical protein